MDIVKDLDLVDLDLVEQSALNETEDDFGFEEAFGYTEEEYNEEWN